MSDQLLNLTNLDGMREKDQKALVELLDEAIHRLQFERRLAALSDKQLDHMSNTSLNSHQKKQLSDCKNDAEKDSLLNNFARLMYFRQCAWVDYLNGVDKEVPVTDELLGSREFELTEEEKKQGFDGK